MAEKVGFVPLPEVNDYTDVLQVHDLGLPDSIDAERIQLHIPRVERIAKLGDIGTVHITGYRDRPVVREYAFAGTSWDGTAATAAVANKASSEGHLGEVDTAGVDDKDIPLAYRWKSSAVRINNTEIEDRIRDDGDKWELGLHDVQARAEYLNLAIKRGLQQATVDAVFKERSPITPNQATVMSGVFKAMGTVMTAWLLEIPLEAGLAVHTGYQAAVAPVSALWHKYGSRQELPPRQWSAFVTHYDRLTMAQILAKNGHLVRAQK